MENKENIANIVQAALGWHEKAQVIEKIVVHGTLEQLDNYIESNKNDADFLYGHAFSRSISINNVVFFDHILPKINLDDIGLLNIDSAIIDAAKSGYIEIIQTILEKEKHEAFIEQYTGKKRDTFLDRCFQVAADRSQTKVAIALLKTSSNLFTESNFVRVFFGGNVELFKFFLENKGDLKIMDYTNSESCKALVEFQKYDLAKYLLDETFPRNIFQHTRFEDFAQNYIDSKILAQSLEKDLHKNNLKPSVKIKV